MDKNLAFETLKSFVKHPTDITVKDAILALHPELAKSKDERIRNLIYCLIRDRRDNRILLEQNGVSVDDALAYLERQKENSKTVYSISADCVSDVKWADTIITRAIVALSDDVDYNRDEPCKYRREIDDLKKLRDVLCGQKEQKTVEKQGYSGLNDLERAILRGFLCAGVENVPVGIIKDTASECMGFLTLIEQKPAEWSEEDKTNGWTGVDLERYLSCLQRLGTGNPQQPETINSKWFKEHCRPQPNWKPSEEQMIALKKAICYLAEYGARSDDDLVLDILYDDLKKL